MNLLKILLGGFLLFMALAMLQEWEVFSESWFGAGEETAELTHEDLIEASNAVRMTLTLMRHLYLSNGDPRFAERMPAAEWVVQEMTEDIGYLRRNGRLQEHSLKQVVILGEDRLGADRVEIMTQEFWTVRILWESDRQEAETPRDQVNYVRYLVARTSGGWRVEGWRPEPPPRDLEGDQDS